MSETTPENDAWVGEDATPAGATLPVSGGPSFPEHHYSLADHIYTWSPKLPDGSMLVIRAQSAEDLASYVEAVVPIAARLRAAWAQVSGGASHAPQMPAQGYQAATPPPFGPNVSMPQAPGYAGPQVPAAPQWGAPAPQSGFGGGLPAGWYKMKVPFAQKATFDGIVSQYGLRKGDPFKGGQVSWRKEEKVWACSPDVAGAFAQFNPVAA